MLVPRVDNLPAHTTRAWTALRVRTLTTLETDALRVDNIAAHTSVDSRQADTDVPHPTLAPLPLINFFPTVKQALRAA